MVIGVYSFIGYWWLLMDILLMDINGYLIGVYLWLF
jgi:hypothetical protein